MPLRLSRAFFAIALRVTTGLVAAGALSSCGTVSETFSKIEFFPARNGEAQKPSAPIMAEKVDPLTAPAPIVDPLNAPPPPTAASTSTAKADPLKAAAPKSDAPKTDPLQADPMAAAPGGSSGSQMVPLGSLNAAAKPAAKRNGPAALIPNAPKPAEPLSPNAIPAPAPAVASASTPTPAPTPAPAPAPVAAAKPAPVAAPAPAPQLTLPPPQPTPVAAAPNMAQPETIAAKPPAAPRTTLADFFNRVSPSTDSAAAAPGTGTLLPPTATAEALPDAREFIPAAITPAQPLMNSAMGSPKLTVGESNIMRRFQVLAKLLDEGLITQEEHDRRRAANVGALLPFSKEPPGLGLDRSVPSPGAISARLQTLGRSLEMRAITSRQHELERGTILNSLLPEKPDPRAPKMPPPSDMFALADAAGRLGYLREEKLISESEFDAEKSAMDRAMRGGDPIERKSMASSTKASGNAMMASNAAAAKPTTAAAAEDEAKAPEKFSGPVLHLASFRSAEGARSAFEQAKAKNPQLFANLRLEARKTNVAGQGTFYRLLVGPFASLSDAEATCVEMKKADQFCRPTADGS